MATCGLRGSFCLSNQHSHGIDALAGFEPIVEVDDVEGGYLYVVRC